MRQTAIKTILTCLLVSGILMACEKRIDSPSDNSRGAKANTVSGNIYDDKGNKFKISGASVVVTIWGQGNIGENDLSYNINMQENGHYESVVTNGVYQFHTRAYIPFNGRKVCIDLEPTDDKPQNATFPSAPGINRDYKLVLSGLSKDGDPGDANAYYGGHIWVGDGAGAFTEDGYWTNLKVKYPGAKVTFTLAPHGPCLDGSDAPSKEIDCSVEDLYSGKYLVNFPLALYRVSAVLTTAEGEHKPLKVTSVEEATGPHYDYIDETFPPDPNDHDGHPGIAQIAVWEN